MPQSLGNVVIHVVFSTKNRNPMIDATVRHGLHAYMATVARNTGCQCYRVGGVADHVHLAIRLSRTITIADFVETVKTATSKWMKTQKAELAEFAWQRGYGCFSVNPGDKEGLFAYIDSQEQHHGGQEYKNEMLAMLKHTNTDYDETYLWE